MIVTTRKETVTRSAGHGGVRSTDIFSMAITRIVYAARASTTLELLQSYFWPGNIRELQNVIERSVILCETEIFSIEENWLPQPPPLTPESNQQVELPRRLLVQEKDMIEAALKDTRGRVSGPTGAAAKLGIPRSTLESKIKSLKIDKNRFRLVG